jgi:hypothetical protein
MIWSVSTFSIGSGTTVLLIILIDLFILTSPSFPLLKEREARLLFINLSFVLTTQFITLFIIKNIPLHHSLLR